MKRIVPVLVLLILSPLIAEYLLGSMSMGQITLLPFMMLLYGAGAVLVRELARRAGKGWLSILFLALAYGILEEGLFIHTLFNPHFHGLRLLDYGFESAIGLALPWTIDVLALHVVWSIGVPIALTELMFNAHRSEPWLGKIGVTVMALLYITGAVMIGFGTFQQEHFTATPMQLAGSAAAALVCIAAAFVLPAPRRAREGTAPSPWLVGVLALAAGSAFLELYGMGSSLHWPPRLVVGGMLAIAMVMALFAFVSARRTGWGDAHRFAMTAGGLLTYCWYGFGVEKSLHGTAAMPAHIALVVVALTLLVFVGWKACKSATHQSLAGG